ncbi:MAG: HK97 family phage prohead protease [Verrucomicrobiia bacterium]
MRASANYLARQTDVNDNFEKSFIQLSNGSRGLRTSLKVKPNAAPDDIPVVEFIASDESIDRAGEVIRAGGWLLENYRKNPVFQNSHQYGDIIFTIGKTEQIEVRNSAVSGNHLYQRVRFAVEENPVAKIAYQLYRGGFLNAVSVGFKPIKWIEGEKAAPARRIYTEQELIEVSAVSIPANSNALAIAAKSGALNIKTLEESMEQIAALISGFKAIRNNPSIDEEKHCNCGFRNSPEHQCRNCHRAGIDVELLRLRALSSALREAIEKIKEQCGQNNRL